MRWKVQRVLFPSRTNGGKERFDNETREQGLMRILLVSMAVVSLAACSPSVPDSAAGVVNRGDGVGFNDYKDYRQTREQQLQGAQASQAVSTGQVAQNQAAAALNSGQAPVDASPANSAPPVVANSAGISGENDFNAVSEQRDIAADAAMIAQNRAQYQVIQPTDLPSRPGSNRPNIVAFALQTTNPVGTALYRRSSLRAEARFAKSCAEFASYDLAQEEFLALGGPERDRKGMDPDGDGFACGWNPAPFRAARGG